VIDYILGKKLLYFKLLEYGAVVEYIDGKTEELREKPAPMPLCPP
jgi:hypothetical protein